jgi:hypothetical protein
MLGKLKPKHFEEAENEFKSKGFNRVMAYIPTEFKPRGFEPQGELHEIYIQR